MMAATSIMSYRELVPNISRKQVAVLAFLRKYGPASNKQLSKRMGWEINRVTPRVKELRDMGLVVPYQLNFDQTTNRFEQVWKAIEIGGN